MELTVGSVYPGKVSGIAKFGVFVELDKNTTGLVHISEVASSFVNDINDFVKVGDEVKVKVLSIDNGKNSLSIKAAAETDRSNVDFKKNSDFKRKNSKPQVFDGINKSKSDAPMSFEDMMAKFMQSSDEKFTDLKRKNGDMRRANRRAQK